MTRLTVEVTMVEREALVELAQRQRRDPRELAAILIRRGLESAGLLPPVNLSEQTQTVAPQAENGGRL